MKNYSEQIANALGAHMEKEGYRYEFDRERGLIRMRFKVKCKLDHVRMIFDIHDTFYISYGCIDMGVDEAARPQVAEYLTRANYGMNIGNFEMDMDDGEVRFKCHVDCDHCDLSPEMIETSLNIPLFMYQRYGDHLLKVMFEMETAKEGIELAEESK